MAAAAAAQELVWLKRLQVKLGLPVHETFTLFEDNQNTMYLSEGQGEHQRPKHVDVKYKYVQQNVKEKVVKLEYFRSQNKLADILTKALVTAVFSFLVVSAINSLSA